MLSASLNKTFLSLSSSNAHPPPPPSPPPYQNYNFLNQHKKASPSCKLLAFQDRSKCLYIHHKNILTIFNLALNTYFYFFGFPFDYFVYCTGWLDSRVRAAESGEHERTAGIRVHRAGHLPVRPGSDGLARRHGESPVLPHISRPEPGAGGQIRQLRQAEN